MLKEPQQMFTGKIWYKVVARWVCSAKMHSGHTLSGGAFEFGPQTYLHPHITSHACDTTVYMLRDVTHMHVLRGTCIGCI